VAAAPPIQFSTVSGSHSHSHSLPTTPWTSPSQNHRRHRRRHRLPAHLQPAMATGGGRGGLSLRHGDSKRQRGLGPLSQLYRLPGGVPGNHVRGCRHHHHQPSQHYAGNREADRRLQALPHLNRPSRAPPKLTQAALSLPMILMDTSAHPSLPDGKIVATLNDMAKTEPGITIQYSRINTYGIHLECINLQNIYQYIEIYFIYLIRCHPIYYFLFLYI